MVSGQRLQILRACAVDRLPQLPGDPAPGALWATKKQLFGWFGDGWLELVEVQAAGKRALPGADWARGAWKPGVHLE